MRLRFFFDPGSSVCFWTADHEAHQLFGDYPVETAKLSLPEALAARGDALIARFDGSVDWEDPAGASPWTREDHLRFAIEARAYLADVAAYRPEISFEDCLRASAAT